MDGALGRIERGDARRATGLLFDGIRSVFSGCCGGDGRARQALRLQALFVPRFQVVEDGQHDRHPQQHERRPKVHGVQGQLPRAFFGGVVRGGARFGHSRNLKKVHLFFGNSKGQRAF